VSPKQKEFAMPVSDSSVNCRTPLPQSISSSNREI